MATLAGIAITVCVLFAVACVGIIAYRNRETWFGWMSCGPPPLSPQVARTGNAQSGFYPTTPHNVYGNRAPSPYAVPGLQTPPLQRPPFPGRAQFVYDTATPTASTNARSTLPPMQYVPRVPTTPTPPPVVPEYVHVHVRPASAPAPVKKPFKIWLVDPVTGMEDTL